MISKNPFFSRAAGSLLVLATAGRLAAAVYNVGNLTDLTNHINLAQPGDQIILSNGVYTTTAPIYVSCDGTATQPIVIASQNIGGAQITGMSGFYLQGATYVTLQGFNFTYTNSANGNLSGLVVDLGSSHCRITRNTFYDDPIQYWCFVQGDDTEVDHNLFQNKVAQGEYVTLDGSHSTLRIAQRLWLHDNDFFNNEYFLLTGGNGGESTRLGLGIWEQVSAWAVVENNLYNQANGDPEAISVKSADDVIRYNTLTNSYGEFNLRAQMRGRIEGNFIFYSGGIRFYDDDNLIFNNYLQGVANGIVFGSGEVAENPTSDVSSGLGIHAATHRTRVEFNTLVNCTNYFDTDSRGNIASDCIVANNVLQESVGTPFVTSELAAGQTNFTWQTNIFYGNSSSQANSPAGGYLNVNPLLVTSNGTPFHIASNSPAIGASYAAPQEVVFDMDGQLRTGVPDLGADEYSAAPIVHRPLGTNDVGPYVAATNFAVVAMPWCQTVMPGLGTTYTNQISPFNGFTNTVTLSVTNLPTGATASFNSASTTYGTNGFGPLVLSVTTSNTTPPGRYTLMITATSSTFTNATVACLTVGNLPNNWLDADIGQPGVQGSADNYLNVVAIKGGGAQIFGTSDQFNFACQPWTNGLILTARVSSQPPTTPSAESGVMIRESTNAGSRYVDVVVTPNSVNMEARTNTGGSAVQIFTYSPSNMITASLSYAPSWVRLMRAGNTYTGYGSSNGVNWVQMAVTSIAMTNTLAGLAVCGYDNTQLNTSTFDNFSLLSTNNPPVITSSPASQYVNSGRSANFTVGTSGSALLSYQWWFNNTNLLAAATNATLTLNNVQSTNAGYYLVVVTNAFGSATSAVATLAVNMVSVSIISNYSSAGSWRWTCPSNVFFVQAECWGGGGAGGSAYKSFSGGTSSWGGGGAGGAYARITSVPVTPETSYTVSIGGGGTNDSSTLSFTGNGTNTTFTGDSGITVTGVGGQGGASAINSGGGAGGLGGINGSLGDAGSIFAGGNGAAGASSYGGGGGAGAGNNSAGAPGVTSSGGSGAYGGGSGANGPTSNLPGSPGGAPGGGGSGGRSTGSASGLEAGGAGGVGQTILTCYPASTVTSSMATSVGTMSAALNGSANDNGNPISERGFFYRISSGVTTNDTKITAGSGAGAFAAVPALSPGTQYYWKAYAINAGGLVLSSELNFSTISLQPPIVTSISMSPGRTAFNLAGSGAANQAYSLLTSSNLMPPVAWVSVATNNAAANGNFSFTDLQFTNFAQRFYRVVMP